MPSDATQKNRNLAIETALGADAVLLRSVSVREQLGRPFSIDVELASKDGQIEFDKIIGTNATVRLELPNKSTRYFNGVVSRFTQAANQGEFARYTATLVPWLWLLTRTADCRIFQNKTIPVILEDVFKGHGLSDFKLKLSETYTEREYCVQYRETDFNFVSRLMEQEGIYYYFTHENGKHVMVIADAISAHAPFPEYAEVTFYELEKGAEGREVLTDWQVEKVVQPGAFALNDFDFIKPKSSLRANANVSRNHASAAFEMYDCPGEYVEHADGERLAKVRLDELQAQHEICKGQGPCKGLSAGHTFTLKKHPRDDQNREYLVTSVSLLAESGEYASGGRSGGDFCSCSLEAIDKAQTFRARQSTPKPVVQGPQTALVTGPGGEEIHVDKYGRVKVQFHWDRYGKADENSSCWVRVAQVWAGKQWGGIYTPRIGQEVIVEFLEGDPDRPIITGRVYNAEAMPPYALPDNKTLSAIKSNSSKGGGGFNEIRFEDKKGEEQIFMHGEKNIDTRIKNDCFEWIGNNRHLVVVKDQFEHVKNNRDETVDADHKEKIGKDRHLKVAGKEAIEIEKSHSFTVKGDVIEVFKENHSEETTKDYYLKAANIVIEGTSNVTIKVGGSSIAIEAGGIGIKTSGQIKVEATGTGEIKSTGPLTLESSATADLKSPMTTVDGSGMATIKGGLVKIN